MMICRDRERTIYTLLPRDLAEERLFPSRTYSRFDGEVLAKLWMLCQECQANGMVVDEGSLEWPGKQEAASWETIPSSLMHSQVRESRMANLKREVSVWLCISLLQDIHRLSF